MSDASQLQRYRFGLRTADFLVCRRCGVYIAAMVTAPAERFATININALNERLVLREAKAISYEGESAAERQRRREQRWTPVIDDA